MFRRLIDLIAWPTFRDYERAKLEITQRTIAAVLWGR